MMWQVQDIVHKTINRMKFGWTKYGGANREIIIDSDHDWSCQACAERLYKAVPHYLVTFEDMPTLKLCGSCRHSTSVNKITQFSELVRVVRH